MKRIIHRAFGILHYLEDTCFSTANWFNKWSFRSLRRI